MLSMGRAVVATCLLLAGAGLCAESAWACDVPVFRYALERWPAAPYEVLIFHRGPLPPEAAEAVADLRTRGRVDTEDATVDLLLADLDAAPHPAAKQFWEASPGESLPWMVVRYPEFLGIEENVWAGPLSRQSVSALTDSPVRRRIARDLLQGESAVFVLLESGNREKDEAAAQLVQTQLAELEKELELPDLPPGQWDDPVYDENGPPKMRLGFELVRLSRTDPAEEVFVRMLIGPAPERLNGDEPVVFPIFGRGRALCAMVGDQITADTIGEEAAFLVGPCSCIVKDQNPGIDMLMTVDWNAALEGQASAIPTVEPPPPAGLAEFAKRLVTSEMSWSSTALVRRAVVAVIVGLGIVTAAILTLRRKRAT
jgi:hypothetical protein